MNNYELMKNRIDNLERGLNVRKTKSSVRRFWHFVKKNLKNKLLEMPIEEAEKLV